MAGCESSISWKDVPLPLHFSCRQYCSLMCSIPGEGFTPSEMGSRLPEPHPYRPGEEQVSSWNIKKAFLGSGARLRRTQRGRKHTSPPPGPSAANNIQAGRASPVFPAPCLAEHAMMFSSLQAALRTPVRVRPGCQGLSPDPGH